MAAQRKSDLEGQDIPISPAGKRFCVVQLTRIGDLIQTYQACSQIKQTHPGLKLTLVARKSFATPILFLLEKTFDSIHLLDFKGNFDSNSSLQKNKEFLSLFIGKINQQPIDVLINLSFSKSSSYLSTLIKAKHRLGLFKDGLNGTLINDHWSQYIYSTTMRGPMNPFSLVDIYRSMLGINNSGHIKQETHNSKSNYVLIHPFASQDKKYWKPNKWVEVIFKILKNHPDLRVKIAGAQNEKVIADEIINSPILQRYRDRVISMVGKTSVEELLRHIKDSRLFIGHDSMVGHLASLTTIPILTLSLGTVRANETSPYSANVLNISPKTKCYPCFPDEPCDFFKCHADIPYQIVDEMVSFLIDETKVFSESFKKISPFLTESVAIKASEISSANFFLLRDINSNNPSIQDLFLTFYRIVFLYMFNNQEEPHSYPSLTDRTFRDLKIVQEGISHLFDLCEFGKKYSRYILEEISSKTPDLKNLKDFSKKIDEIDHLQLLLVKTHPVLDSLTSYFNVNKCNIHGKNIVELTESSFMAYHNASLICSTLYDIIDKSLNDFAIKRKRPAIGQGGAP